ncbi:hypothetical protein ACLOJK_025440 [Asimina triloba]
MRFHETSFKESRNIPSFSSSLLDAIYRSIDEGELSLEEEAAAEMVFYRETSRKKQSNDRRAEGEKQKTERLEFGLKPSDSEDGSRRSSRNQKPMFFKSSSSSSESSYSGGFGFSSSSEAESVQSRRPKPIRTGFRLEKPLQFPPEKTQFPKMQPSASLREKPSKRDGFFHAKASAASKIYSDTKKAGQPVSPGGRIASFLNSLFSPSNSKKAKMDESRSRFAQTATPTCSSSSSYTRSCLSKTPSSRGNSTASTKRSVRFYPVSVIVDEDCRPCGEKLINDCNITRKAGPLKPSIGSSDELKLHLMEKSRRIEEAAKDLLYGYQKKTEFLEEVMRSMHAHGHRDGDVDCCLDGDDDDGYSSSDLFELEIGIGRFREELPVYETTRLDANRAFASALMR